MLCDICKKAEATIHFTQIAEGKAMKLDLCEACAKAKGITEPGFTLAELFAGFAPPEPSEETRTEAPGVRCSFCGMTQGDFKKIGRFGCAQCWSAFEDGLGQLLRAMHKGDRHVGKVPGKAAHTLVINEKIKQLTEELQKAIRDEQYEQAAVIRDQIRTLERKLNAP
ncbi:MAG: UvrB/UvrC motif-containing protein [Verrucomicrobiae bacterium]|nr:UvrB/UvrC motif-containing protein [Verrucomicrobiae bacterium]